MHGNFHFLLAPWLRKRSKEWASRIEVDVNSNNDAMVYPPFEFSVTSPPSITDGTKDDNKDFPGAVWTVF
ncbi:hypothetical protein ACSQ67_012184 [Phaseolus vulgaris]